MHPYTINLTAHPLSVKHSDHAGAGDLSSPLSLGLTRKLFGTLETKWEGRGCGKAVTLAALLRVAK